MNVASSPSVHSCTSCQLCAAVCNKDAIKIALDADGYYRPIVDEELCVDCGLCTRVCYKYDKDVCLTTEEELKDRPLYSAWSNDDQLVSQTTSGGIGDLLAHKLLNQGYEVVGVVYDDYQGRAEHHTATTSESLNDFRGSKYIQSYTYDAFKEVVAHIRDKRYAVFGTPCQIYALNRLATQRKVRDNFFFVDLYCHGCPSLHVWTKYRQHIADKLQLKSFDRVSFRSKIRGWGAFYVVVVVDGKIVFKSNPREDGFYELFFSDQVLNEGCHDCQLRSTLEYTDIRLGDFWGRKFLNNHRGVSAVSVCTDRGQKIFHQIDSLITTNECSYSDFLPYQSWGKTYHPNSTAREAILASLRTPQDSITDAVNAFRCHQGIMGHIKRHVKNILASLPVSITSGIKNIIYS